MENRSPGPEDTDSSKSASSVHAESIAAWLHFQRQNEHNENASKSKAEEEEDDDDDDTSISKSHWPLKLGILPLKSDEDKQAAHWAEEPESANEKSINVDEQPFAAEVQEDDYQQATASTEYEDFQRWENEMQTAEEQTAANVSSEQEDFRQWEEELKTAGPEAGSADMQMEEDEEENPPQKPVVSKHTPHQPRQAASMRPMNVQKEVPVEHKDETPKAAAGGGGDDIPPSDGRPTPNESGDDWRRYAYGAQLASESSDIRSSSTIEAHEHRHSHPRLATAMFAGLLVEHALGKRADRKIKREMRKQDDALRKQIKQTQETQGQVNRTLETKQIRMAAEQDRQRRVLEQVHSSGSAERASVHTPRQMESMRPMQIDAEPLQRPEQGSALSAEFQAEDQKRQRIVMEQVAVAAEYDEPVERVYERRQEVKDEPSSPAGAAAGGAASVGSVLVKSSAAAYQKDGSNSASASGQSQGHIPHQQSDVDYRAAAMRGVGAALALIVLALLAYLIF